MKKTIYKRLAVVVVVVFISAPAWGTRYDRHLDYVSEVYGENEFKPVSLSELLDASGEHANASSTLSAVIGGDARLVQLVAAIKQKYDQNMHGQFPEWATHTMAKFDVYYDLIVNGYDGAIKNAKEGKLTGSYWDSNLDTEGAKFAQLEFVRNTLEHNSEIMERHWKQANGFGEGLGHFGATLLGAATEPVNAFTYLLVAILAIVVVWFIRAERRVSKDTGGTTDTAARKKRTPTPAARKEQKDDMNNEVSRIEKIIGTWGLSVISYIIAIFIAILIMALFYSGGAKPPRSSYLIIIIAAVFIRQFVMLGLRACFVKIDKKTDKEKHNER